jgi:nicotinamide riboside transporter PnuC
MKLRGTFVIFLLTLVSICQAATLTPEQFLETQVYSSAINRQYAGNMLLTVGFTVLGSTLFFEDSENKSAVATAGVIYLVEGGVMKYRRSRVERKAMKFTNDQEISALDQVVELKNNAKRWRYIGSALIALPLMFDYTWKKSSSESQSDDAEIILKTMSAGTVIGMLIFKTPFERLCDDVILGHNKRDISLQFSPGFDNNALAIRYNF